MLRIPVLLFLLVGCSGVAGAEPSRTVQEFRSHMFDAPVRSLANRTVKMMFNTAKVGRGPATSILPGVTGEMAFTYNYAGVTHKADDIVERTFTDAILIMKNGRIVVEQYYNRADDQTYFNSFSIALK